jgi:SpoVK/Ycf46/Vps4 family AAA+-type ATPase
MDEEQFVFAEEIINQNTDIISWASMPFDVIENLRKVSDYSQTECFRGLYGLETQIRMLMNVLYHGVRSLGGIKSHGLLVGSPGCGKSTVLSGIANVVGENAVLRVDATNSTGAGISKLLFELPVVPNILLFEEVDKASADDLAIMLSLLDGRNEIRKITARGAYRRSVSCLVIATCNSIERLEKMCNGAIASRFASQIYFPKPDMDMLRLILTKHAENNGIHDAPVDEVLQLSVSHGITDTRILCSYLLQDINDIKSNLLMKQIKRQPSKRKIDVCDLNNLILERSDA